MCHRMIIDNSTNFILNCFSHQTSPANFIQNAVLKGLRFSRHSQQKYRKPKQTTSQVSCYEAVFTEDWGPRTEDWGLRNEDWGPSIEDWGLRTEEWGPGIEDWGPRTEDRLRTEDRWPRTEDRGTCIKDRRPRTEEQGLRTKDWRPKIEDEDCLTPTQDTLATSCVSLQASFTFLFTIVIYVLIVISVDIILCWKSI